MPRVQLLTNNLPIILTPRIAGNIVTVTQLKANSNHFQNDTDTPMRFYMEYADISGVAQTLSYDPIQTSDNLIIFATPIGFYSTQVKYAVMFYYTVTDAHSGKEIERGYTRTPVPLEITDMRNRV